MHQVVKKKKDYHYIRMYGQQNIKTKYFVIMKDKLLFFFFFCKNYFVMREKETHDIRKENIEKNLWTNQRTKWPMENQNQ